MFLAMTILVYVTLSVTRNVAIVSHYGGPMRLYGQLGHLLAHPSTKNASLCLGDEWSRFPSNYFLPSSLRVRWIRSSYHHSLPHYFSPYPKGFSEPPDEALGFNPYNHPPPASTFADPQTQCDYVILDGEDERHRLLQQTMWKRVACVPFLDRAATSHPTARIFGIPPNARIWSDYCLYQCT